MRNGADAVRDSMTTGDSLSGVSVAVEQLLCYHQRLSQRGIVTSRVGSSAGAWPRAAGNTPTDILIESRRWRPARPEGERVKDRSFTWAASFQLGLLIDATLLPLQQAVLAKDPTGSSDTSR